MHIVGDTADHKSGIKKTGRHQMQGKSQLKHWFLGALSAVCLTLIFPVSADAQFYVRSPDVEKGELKLEEHGAIYSGPGEDERRRQSHELEAKYGFTNRWEGIVEGFFRQDIGESLTARQFELGAQYEIVEREGDGLGVAFRGIYELSLIHISEPTRRTPISYAVFCLKK